MKWIALIVSLLGLIGCAASDRSASTFTAVPIENTAAVPPTRSIDLPSTRAAVIPATIPPIVTEPIETVTPIKHAPTSTTHAQPTGQSTVPECPPLPAPTEVKTQAAVQHFEHGLMFWLQERGEIWALVASPLEGQFYWRMLPNLWSEGQPESHLNLSPPAGRFQPVRGFGVAWRLGGGSYGQQRDDLGWAVDEEIGFDTTLIYYPQGFYSPNCTWMPKSGIYELRDTQGMAYQFVGAGGIAKIVTSSGQ